ncbi:tetratricopeptide repeat protein [Thalassobellus sediminis]|uniref:tetratricopeptide repeat protein n=1 Tax=Thalassobellus sediminis TaxID=3367753 RepID=UPI003799A1E5
MKYFILRLIKINLTFRIFIFFLIAYTTQTSNAQSDKVIDSIQKLIPTLHDSLKFDSYILIFKKTLRKKPDLSKTYLDSATYISNNLKEIKTKQSKTLKLYDNLGEYYYRISDFKKLEELDEKIVSIYLKKENKKKLAVAYNNISRTQQRLSKFEKSIESVMKSLKLQDELGYAENKKAFSYRSLVTLYGKILNYEKSNFYNKKLEDIYTKSNDSTSLASVWGSFGLSYKKAKDYDNALKYYKKSSKIYEVLKNKNALAHNYNYLGSLYISKDSLELAKRYLKEALNLGKAVKDKPTIAVSLNNLGVISNRQKKFNDAIEYLEDSKKIGQEIGHRHLLIDVYFNLSRAYFGKRDYRKAYINRSYQTKLKDSIFKRESIDKINELEIKYQTEIKEQQILIQDKEIELLKHKEENNNLQRLLLAIGFFLSLIGFYGIRQKLKRNKLEKLKLNTELAFKKKELTTHALHLAKKNEVLAGLRQKAKELKTSENNSNGYQQLIRTINFDLKDDNNWKNFSKYFQDVHKDFNSNVKQKYPEVTSNELRLMSLLKMNLSSKEIANILNISPEGIKKARYRLRKKLNINTDDSLQDLILNL